MNCNRMGRMWAVVMMVIMMIRRRIGRRSPVPAVIMVTIVRMFVITGIPAVRIPVG